MPDNPFKEKAEKSGDLREFGLPFEEGIVEKDNPDDAVEETEEAPPVEEVGRDAPTKTPIEPVEEAGEEEEEEGDEYDSMLNRVRGQYETKPEVEEGDETSALKQRLAAVEGRLRTYEPQAPPVAPVAEPKPEPKPEAAGIDYADPAVQAAIAQGLSDPRTAGSTIQALVSLEAKNLIGKELGTVREQVQRIEQATTEDSARSELSAQLATGLQQAYNMGGLEAAVVREAEQKREGSMLYQYFAMYPDLATSPQGIVTGVLAVSRAVQRADAELKSKSPTEKRKGPAPLTARRQTRATKRGDKLIKPKEEGTVEDQVKADILRAGRPSQAIEFMR